MSGERPRSKTTPGGRQPALPPEGQAERRAAQRAEQRAGSRPGRRRRGYTLSIEPDEAIEQLVGSEELEQLSSGTTTVQGQRVEGWLETRGHVLTMGIAPWIDDVSLRVAHPPVHVVLELQPTERGCRFHIHPPSRQRLMTTLASAVLVATLGVVPVALLSVKWALLESLVLLGILAHILWKERRFGASFRRTLIDVVWQVWSPFLPPEEGEGARALAAAGEPDEPDESAEPHEPQAES